MTFGHLYIDRLMFLNERKYIDYCEYVVKSTYVSFKLNFVIYTIMDSIPNCSIVKYPVYYLIKSTIYLGLSCVVHMINKNIINKCDDVHASYEHVLTFLHLNEFCREYAYVYYNDKINFRVHIALDGYYVDYKLYNSQEFLDLLREKLDLLSLNKPVNH